MKSVPILQINIFQRIGSRAAVSLADGEEIFVLIEKSFEKEIMVVLDFNNITAVSPTFLNAAIGQLYSKYMSFFISMNLEVKNLELEDRELLRRVVINAKRYFEN